MTFRTGVAGYWVTAVLATAATTACGDATAPAPEPGPPGLHIVSGATGRDTVLAWLSEPLVVVVRDADGLPLVGESVRYATTWQGSETPSALVAAEPGTLAHDVHTATTDRAGTARAAIRLGARAGPASVRVSVPRTGEEITVTYTTEAGKPHAILTPTEAWIVLGQRHLPDLAVVDRHENRRAEGITLTSAWSGVEVDGVAVTGRAFGRGDIIARWQGISATFSVTVGPPGRIAGVARSGIFDGTGPGDPAIYLLTLGRDGLRVVTSGLDVAWPTLSPVDSTLVFTTGPLMAEVRPGELRYLDHPDVGLTREMHPQFGLGGEWVYFTGVPGHQNGEIWRIPARGGEAQRVGPEAEDWYQFYGYPSPSPDGSRVALLTNTFAEGPPMAVLDTETGQITAFGREGIMPRWSPTGEWIAYITAGEVSEGEIRIMRPDGSEDHAISEPGRRYWTGVAWSPDGTWLVAYADDTRRTEFFEIATGLRLVHPWASDLTHPSWGR